MKQEKVLALKAALQKRPEDRTEAEKELVKEWGPNASDPIETSRGAANPAKATERPSDIEMLQDMIARLRAPASQWAADSSRGLAARALSNSFGRILEAQRNAWEQQAREKEQRQEREVAMVSALDGILRTLKGVAEPPQKHDDELQDHEEELTLLRSGAPGRPSVMHFIEEEFDRRVDEGQMEDTLSEQARVLSKWLRSAHPDFPRVTPKTIENRLRASFRRARLTMPDTGCARPKRTKQPKK